MSRAKRRHQGFTLLELLITLAILGVLIAIAVPQYGDYRKRAFDIRAASDLRNVANAEEAYFFDEEQYLSCQNQTCNNLPGISALSLGTALQITANQSSFTGSARHPKGSGKTFIWDSEKGGMQD